MLSTSHILRRVVGGVLLLAGTTGGTLAEREARARRAAPKAPRLVARVVMAPTREQLLRDSIVEVARAQVGKRYALGGAVPQRGFDCSGLVSYVLSQVHFKLPRTARQQAKIGAPIERTRLKPGDLLTFGHGEVSHVGIYVGRGQYVHASSVAGRVIISPIDRGPSRLIRPLAGARRFLSSAGD